MNPAIMFILAIAPVLIWKLVVSRKRVPLTTAERAVRLERSERRGKVFAGVAAALTLVGLIGHNWGLVTLVFPFALVSGLGTAFVRLARTRS